jgi:hypothetical protein
MKPSRRGHRILDELLFGDPMRRFVFGSTLLLIAGLAAVAAWWRHRRSGHSLLPPQVTLRIALSFAPVGIGIVFSAFWGLLGALAFFAVAVAVCGVGVLVTLVRGS